MDAPIGRTARWWELGLAAGAAWAVHGATLGNFLYTHDGWNDVLLGETIAAGGIGIHENLLRILPTLSFGLRALSDLSMIAWHLPNVLLHGVCAALVVALAARLQVSPWARRVAGVVFGVAPLLAHPVEWIGGGYDIFATCGVLVAAVAFLDRRPWLTAVGVLVAVLSKEVGATAPAILALLAFALPGAHRQLLRRLAPAVVIVVLALGLRWAQVSQAPDDALAGRSVAARPGAFALSAPAGVGLAAVAGLAELLELRDPERALPIGWAAVLVLLIGVVARQRGAKAGEGPWRPLAALAGAGAIALAPVSLIAMDAAMMVENTRYLYLSAALLAPVLPAILIGPGRRPELAVGAVLLVIATWGGVDRVAKSLDQADAAEAVAREVLKSPPQTRVWVLSGLYDEATARFLMSHWLHSRRQIRALYVMRGTGRTYARRPGAGHDAAQSYFGPAPGPFQAQSVAASDRVLLQDAIAARVLSVAPAAAAGGAGRKAELTGPWLAVAPPDPEDEPVRITDGGRTLHVERYLGPIASAEVVPGVQIQLPETGGSPLRRVVLDLRVRSSARPRYGSGYHERFGVAFIGGWSASYELRAGGGLQRVALDLTWDPVSARGAVLGLLPLNYPGTVTVERVEVAW